MSCERHELKKAKARELRWLGFSTPHIAKMLAVKSPRTISEWTVGIPNPEWTKRPRAKDDLRVVARRMRQEGRSYREIRAEVPVSKSTLSLWLKDVPISEEQRALLRRHRLDAGQRRATALRARRIATQRRIWKEAAAEIGALSERELLIAGVIAYWAEGSKAKPWRSVERLQFINSDPTMIRLFIAWLRLFGITTDDLVFRISIHENADYANALEFWAREVGVSSDTFRRPTLKRHNPRTIRKNSGSTYVGCLTINVRRSTEMYRWTTGWYEGIIKALGPGVTAARRPLEASGPGSNPGGPATLFEPPTPYLAARAS
jgi:hypothetical protein